MVVVFWILRGKVWFLFNLIKNVLVYINDFVCLFGVVMFFRFLG